LLVCFSGVCRSRFVSVICRMRILTVVKHHPPSVCRRPRLQPGTPILNRHRFGILPAYKLFINEVILSSIRQEVSQTGDDSLFAHGTETPFCLRMTYFIYQTQTARREHKHTHTHTRESVRFTTMTFPCRSHYCDALPGPTQSVHWIGTCAVSFGGWLVCRVRFIGTLVVMTVHDTSCDNSFKPDEIADK